MSDQPTPHEGLPVHGYRPQSDEAVNLVNINKTMEEVVLRTIDDLRRRIDIDQRWLSIAQTHFEQGYMALNRAIFQPKRIKLATDSDPKRKPTTVD